MCYEVRLGDLMCGKVICIIHSITVKLYKCSSGEGVCEAEIYSVASRICFFHFQR